VICKGDLQTIYKSAQADGRIRRRAHSQALHLAEALARGEPNRGRIALTLFRNKIKEYF